MAPHQEPLIFYFLSKMTKKTEKEGCFTAQRGTFIFVFFGQQGLGLRPNQLFKKKKILQYVLEKHLTPKNSNFEDFF